MHTVLSALDAGRVLGVIELQIYGYTIQHGHSIVRINKILRMGLGSSYFMRKLRENFFENLNFDCYETQSTHD